MRFLEAFARTGNVTIACSAAMITRTTHYTWLDGDPLYVKAFAEAQKVANDCLLAEARRRAVQGSRRLKFTRDGELITIPAQPREPGAYTVKERCEATDDGARPEFIETKNGVEEIYVRDVWRKPYEEFVYSDALLMFLMKAEEPTKYREDAPALAAASHELEKTPMKRIEVSISDVHPDDLQYIHRITGVAPAAEVFDPKSGAIVKRDEDEQRRT